MLGPSEELRRDIAESADSVLSDASDDTAESWLDDQLAYLADAIRGDSDEVRADDDQQEAMWTLAAAQSWASVVSYTLGRVYAPTSPWPRRLAGWATKIGARLQIIITALHAALSTAVQALSATLGITSYSVGLSFPWGVSVGVSF